MTIPGEHTEGPWAYTCAHWTGHGQDTYSVYHYAWGPLAYTAGPSDYGPSRAEANARLMAAAPQLLDALYTALNLGSVARWGAEVVHSESRANIDVPYHFAVIRAAIAAAVAPGYSGAPTG